MAAPAKSNSVIAVLIGFAIAAVVYYVNSGHGPLDPEVSQRLMTRLLDRERLKSGSPRMDVIAPDGEPALAPVALLGNVQVFACPKISGTRTSVQGRWGGTGKTYAASSYECLFTVDGPDGLRFHLGAHVWRSDDPTMPTASGGFSPSLMKPPDTLALMNRLERRLPGMDKAAQRALWDRLAKLDVYVPADARQPSPIERAMQSLKNRSRND